MFYNMSRVSVQKDMQWTCLGYSERYVLLSHDTTRIICDRPLSGIIDSEIVT